MKVLNFGSLNIDFVYRVHHIVRPGETIAAGECNRYSGGKGLNQSIALARAGADVFHGGMIGTDGQFLKEMLEENGVDCRFLLVSETVPSGNAIIQVGDDGENSIVLFGGANKAIPAEHVKTVWDVMEPGDCVVLQNEISATADVMKQAAQRGLRVFFNPAPMGPEVAGYPLECVDTLILNDTETEEMRKLAPVALERCNLLLTHGARGASYRPVGGEEIFVPACHVEHVVDTTAAGDTFIGYFVAALCSGTAIREALEEATKASAITVSRPGAAPSIPYRSELQ